MYDYVKPLADANGNVGRIVRVKGNKVRPNDGEIMVVDREDKGSSEGCIDDPEQILLLRIESECVRLGDALGCNAVDKSRDVARAVDNHAWGVQSLLVYCRESTVVS